MLQSLPNDILEHVFAFLVNDGISVGRLSLCSQSLYQHISRDSPDLWKRLVRHRWSMRPSEVVVFDEPQLQQIQQQQEEDEVENDPRRTYWRRHAIDRRARDILDQMILDLKESLQLPDNANRLDGNRHVGQAWDHLLWKELLALRGNVLDFLREEAGRSISMIDRMMSGAVTAGAITSTCGFDDRLRSFLAARSLQTIQFAECLHEWKAIQELTQQQPVDQQAAEENSTVVDDCTLNALLLERYALLVNEMQQTPDQLILRHRHGNVKESVRRRLDGIAEACREQILQVAHEASRAGGGGGGGGSPESSMGVLDKIQIINNYLFQQEGFKGNSDDYYNYRNSLIEWVLDSKKGIPITLAVLYSCICRRLQIDVYLVGLPGHVVLGFATNEDDSDNPGVHFLDVFRQGELLTEQDCRRICLSYNVPFFDKYIQPLPAHQVLQRILNNLANCHFHGLATGNEPFHSDLFFHQRALASIHRQPPGIAAPLVDRVTQELPLTLSPDLLRFYGLLSPSSSSSHTVLQPHASSGSDSD